MTPPNPAFERTRRFAASSSDCRGLMVKTARRLTDAVRSLRRTDTPETAEVPSESVLVVGGKLTA